MNITIEDEFITCKYKGIKYIGEGAYGKVFFGEDIKTKSNVAIKYIDFRKMNGNERDKVLQEGQVLFKVNHKNIITFEDFFYNR